MKPSHVVFGLLLLTGICLVGCDKSLEPTMEPGAIESYEPDLENLQAAAGRHVGIVGHNSVVGST